MSTTSSPSFFHYCWRAVRRLVFAFATLVTLITLFYVIENWRGRHAWERYKADLTARGERFELPDSVPPAVPPEQNFAETPVLKAITYKSRMDMNVWSKFESVRGVQSYSPMGPGAIVGKEDAADVLTAFKEIEPELDELRAAAKRPYAQFIRNHTNAFLADVPNFIVLRKLSQLFTIHAYAELASDHSGRAFDDIRVVQRLADSLDGQSTLVEAMIRVAILGLTLQPFEQGLSTGAWSDEQLASFQKYFESVDLLTGFDAALRAGERNSVLRLVQDLPREQLMETLGYKDAKHLKEHAFNLAARWCPRGWYFQNAVNYSRLMQKSFESYDVKGQRFFPAKCDEAIKFINEQMETITPFKYLASVAVPNITKATQVTAHTQTQMLQAALACALERYRRARGEYPETLAALVPQLLAKIPADLLTGEAPRYQRVEKDKFLLYSVGWNLKDDGGVRKKERTEGDWVWPPAR